MLSMSYAGKNAYSAGKPSGVLRGCASGAKRWYVLAHCDDGTNEFLAKFWYLKKTSSSSKTDKVRATFYKSLKFSIENLSKAKWKSLRLS